MMMEALVSRELALLDQHLTSHWQLIVEEKSKIEWHTVLPVNFLILFRNGRIILEITVHTTMATDLRDIGG